MSGLLMLSFFPTYIGRKETKRIKLFSFWRKKKDEDRFSCIVCRLGQNDFNNQEPA
jgi:hypothetical protein